MIFFIFCIGIITLCTCGAKYCKFRTRTRKIPVIFVFQYPVPKMRLLKHLNMFSDILSHDDAVFYRPLRGTEFNRLRMMREFNCEKDKRIGAVWMWGGGGSIIRKAIQNMSGIYIAFLSRLGYLLKEWPFHCSRLLTFV